jgi:CheY-like chemotaxis protein
VGQEATCPSAQTTGKDRKKVLIIDENALERQSLEKALVSSGYSVLACGSGRRALQECLKQDPDLVVLHEEPGDEFSRYASKRLLEGRNGPPIPVILILPKAKERNVPASGVEGVAAVFPHPVADEVLLSAIEKALLHGWMRQPHTLEDIVRSIAESRGVLGDGQAKGSGNGGLEHMAHRIGEHLRDEILLAVRPLSSDGPERLLQALTERVLSRAVLGRLAHEASELAADMQAQGLLSNSSTISFPDLLQALSQRRVTGILTISARGNKLDVLLRDGSIVFLNPRAIDLSAFGETLHCSYHAFPVAHVAEALAKSSCEDDSLFYYLGEDRKISPEEVPEIMASLGLEILSRCVLQEEDFRFQFRHREALGERFIQHDLELPAQRLLLKLSTRLDEWRALQKPSLDGEATRFAATATAAGSASRPTGPGRTTISSKPVRFAAGT